MSIRSYFMKYHPAIIRGALYVAIALLYSFLDLVPKMTQDVRVLMDTFDWVVFACKCIAPALLVLRAFVDQSVHNASTSADQPTTTKQVEQVISSYNSYLADKFPDIIEKEDSTKR
jgi:uncharacterized protein YoxC